MLTIQNLIDDLAQGCKPKSAFRLGIEHEQFAFNIATGMPLPYEGAPGLRQLFETFATAYEGWEPYLENGNLILLAKKTPNGAKTFSLEPGGQIEFSGAPCKSVREAADEMNAFYKDLAPVLTRLGIGTLRTGFHPRWKREEINWMPKERHAIMKKYMLRTGTMGQDMMLRTCGTQLNVDFESEADMVRKFRVTLALQPMVNAIMANSKMVEGKRVNYASFRGAVWQDVDNDRSGPAPFVFDQDMGFARYVDYALSVPMYFFRRGGHHIDVAGLSFRDFMAGKLKGHEGEIATLADWHDHLTTLFPAVRLKHYLELRGPDSDEPGMVIAMTAFWAGILHDAAALNEAYRIISAWPVARYLALDAGVPEHGLEFPMEGLGPWRDLAAFAGDMLHLAQEGLARQALEKDSCAFLNPFWTRLGLESGCAKKAAR